MFRQGDELNCTFTLDRDYMLYTTAFWENMRNAIDKDAIKGEKICVKIIGMTQSEIRYAMRLMRMFQSMNEITTGISLIANELKIIKRTWKKLECRVPDLLEPTGKWIKELQGEKEHNLDKSKSKARLGKVKLARSSTLKLVNLIGKLHKLLASPWKVNMASDSDKIYRLKGLIKAFLDVNKEEDISKIDTRAEQLSLEGFEKK